MSKSAAIFRVPPLAVGTDGAGAGAEGECGVPAGAGGCRCGRVRGVPLLLLSPGSQSTEMLRFHRQAQPRGCEHLQPSLGFIGCFLGELRKRTRPADILIFWGLPVTISAGFLGRQSQAGWMNAHATPLPGPGHVLSNQ